MNILTCAAPNLRERPSNAMNPHAGDKAAKITPTELEKLLTARIRRIFEIAVVNGSEVVILGALGCGAFRNPPPDRGDGFQRCDARLSLLFRYDRVCRISYRARTGEL